MEYNERDRFREIRKFEISLIQFKYILKDVFPSSVFVARDENLLFQNTILEQNFCDLLGGIPFNLTQIKNILVDQKQYPLDQNFTAIKNEEQLLLNTRDAPPLNLYNFLKFTEMDDLIPNNFINLHGNLPIVRNGEKDQIFLDIKIGSILWEGEKALLVILDENKIIKKYRELNEQSIYKDKLLATVSHDLRTPLNGVIGILKLILENTEDRQKRKR
jgi:signal transduction histidine kinase